MWFLLVVSTLCVLLATASVLGLTVSVVNAIANGGKTLLTHCKFPEAVGYSSITNECPFDPTRIYVSYTDERGMEGGRLQGNGMGMGGCSVVVARGRTSRVKRQN